MRSIFTVIGAGIFTASCVCAQSNGRVTGLVVDPTGASVPEATVELRLIDQAVAVLRTRTSTEGIFSLLAVRPETYDIHVEATGFRHHALRRIKVDPGREVALPVIQLEVGAVSDVVEVADTVQGIQTTNAEVTTTLFTEQIRGLPMIDRDPLALIKTQAGVTEGRGFTVINGQRTSFSNVTIDGINIQDNLIRENALDFLPNLLLLDQVGEFTVVTSNSSAAVGGGSSGVIFVTPSGGNDLHGSLYWSNRNSAAAANPWFSNQRGIPKTPLNQNQAGFTLGGPVIRNKLFYYGNYELFRLNQDSQATAIILTEDARRGIFTYRDVGGTVRKVNVLQTRGVTLDPTVQQLMAQIPGPEKINNLAAGDSREGFLRNTGGYSFLRRSNRTRDHITAKTDYYWNDASTLTGTFIWNRDKIDRGELGGGYDVIPKVKNDQATKLLSLGWRWTPTPSFTNELRGGFNLAPGLFLTSQEFPRAFFDGLNFTNPINDFMPEGRYTNTYGVGDNASYVRGKHNFQFGYQGMFVRSKAYTNFDVIPTYFLGIGTGNTGLAPAQLPGVTAADFAAANGMLGALGGFLDGYTQNFNVTSRNSGFVPGAGETRNFLYSNQALYLQDTLRLRRNLTLNLGVRYDYWSPADERDGLALMPVIQNNDPIGTLLSNATLDFAGGDSGRKWHKKDLNNFAPNVGISWDPFGSGRTAIRAGYSVSYVNDELIISADNNTSTNAGLTAANTRTGLQGFIRNGLPAITTPAYKVPRTMRDNFALDPFSASGLPDPNLRLPYVQQWNFSIQRQIRKNIVEVRYVGNHATKQFRAFDYNQIVIGPNGFLDDFKRARQNGVLAEQAGRGYDPLYNPLVSGSQPLPVFGRLEFGGLLTNSVVIGQIRTGEAAGLANIYQTNGLNGSVGFYQNPFSLGTNLLTNYSNATYHGLTAEVRRQYSRGLYLQGNYTYSKVLSDSVGSGPTRFEAFLDRNNGAIERARTLNDLNHVFKLNTVYEIPLGKGHRIAGRAVNWILGGWHTGANLIWQSGTPFSILSGRNTFNRAGRSGSNTAITSLNKQQLDEMFRFRMTGNGPMIVTDSAINPADFRGVGADLRAPFNGQVFFNPGPGEIGSLQRRLMSGPSAFGLDFALRKKTEIRDGHVVEIRMDAQNILNHATFFAGDQNINSTQFGRITSTFFDRRLLQFGLAYRF